MGHIGKIKVKNEFKEMFTKLCAQPLENGYFRSGVTTRIGDHKAIFYVWPAVTMNNKLSIYKYYSLLGASNGFNRIKNMFDIRLFSPDVIAVILNRSEEVV